MGRRFLTMCVAALSVVASPMFCRGQKAAEAGDDHRDVIKSIDQVSCVFAERAVRFRYAWEGKSKQVTHVEWQLTIGDRVVSRGNIRPAFVADDVNGDHVAFSLEMPPVKPEVVIAGELVVTLHADKTPSAPFKQPLFIFAEDPFIDREQWLKGLNIQLFDPNNTTSASSTSTAFRLNR